MSLFLNKTSEFIIDGTGRHNVKGGLTTPSRFQNDSANVSRRNFDQYKMSLRANFNELTFFF